MPVQAHHVILDMPLVRLLYPGVRVSSLVDGSQAVQVGVVHEKDRIISSQLQSKYLGV